MQLSILIPIYNFFIKDLVENLNDQAKSLNLTFEILLVDDCSNDKFHQENIMLGKFSNVNYERLESNIGRTKIRNYLFEKATYQNCLVLDCDVSIISSVFIKTYLEYSDSNSVIVGGHIYQKEPPMNTSLLLHWKYGSQVECKSFMERSKRPIDSFMTNSFLIQKEVSNQVKFDESIQQYGHEDTVFGVELEINNIVIRHIDNPVLHKGLKEVKDFLCDEIKAIENLVQLSQKAKIKNRIIQKSKLLKYEKSMLLSVYYFFFSLLYGNDLEKKLLSDSPSLKVLNYWKYLRLKKLR
jgi:glycosyltransferase involved in cell wall biosynthesis